MPIKIVEQGDDLYTAEVITPQGTWRSPDPLPSVELDSELIRMGCNVLEIERAFQEVGVVHTPDSTYNYVARITRPFLQAALAGERKVPKQEPIAEAWLAIALFHHDRMLSLREVIGLAYAIQYLIPNYDEISWAFLCLRWRGWLAVEGDMYGLTPEGRIAVKEIVDRGGPPSWVRKFQLWFFLKTYLSASSKRTRPIEKLEDWISKHPLPGDE
jgi:hypothetical protein